LGFFIGAEGAFFFLFLWASAALLRFGGGATLRGSLTFGPACGGSAR
jgi:hypothetical protein